MRTVIRRDWWVGVLRKAYPWPHVALRLVAIALSPPTQRVRHQIGFWRAVYRLDFAGLLGAVMELAQPEFWV